MQILHLQTLADYNSCAEAGQSQRIKLLALTKSLIGGNGWIAFVDNGQTTVTFCKWCDREKPTP